MRELAARMTRMQNGEDDSTTSTDAYFGACSYIGAMLASLSRLERSEVERTVQASMNHTLQLFLVLGSYYSYLFLKRIYFFPGSTPK